MQPSTPTEEKGWASSKLACIQGLELYYLVDCGVFVWAYFWFPQPFAAIRMGCQIKTREKCKKCHSLSFWQKDQKRNRPKKQFCGRVVTWSIVMRFLIAFQVWLIHGIYSLSFLLLLFTLWWKAFWPAWPILSQFWSFKIRPTTFLHYSFADLQIFKL